MLRNIIFLVLTVVGVYTKVVFSQETVKTVKTVKAVNAVPPKIDGIFYDTEWIYGGKATGFIQMDPDEGEPASEKTETYFLYDDNNLYIGIKCFDKEPDKIINKMGSRDNILGVDYVSIYLDTFHDHLNAYSFGVTVAGTKSDGRWYSDNIYDISWNGVWWAETAITDFGWVAEFKIPFSTMQFSKKDFTTWGLNIQRIIMSKMEIFHWQNVLRDDGKRVSKFGHLNGLIDIKQGVNLEILPYLTSRIQKDRITSLKFQNENGITGLDVKYGLTSNLTATLTVNPDFAQIEADEDLINLTRYPLYLPEKRPFFTEGASIFSTAGRKTFYAPIYSRRINEPVYGLKINGKIGDWDVGLLNSLNENDVGIQNRINSGKASENSNMNALYSLLRLSRDVFSKSQIGLLALSKEYHNGYNRYIGIDGRLRLNSNYEVLFEGIKSFSLDNIKSSHSIVMETVRRTDLFSFLARYREQTPGYEGNEIGFNNYNDFREAFFWVQLGPRFEKIGIRQFLHNIYVWGENFWDCQFLNKDKLTRNWMYSTNIILMNYWVVSGFINKGYEYDRVDKVLYPVNYKQIELSNNPVSRVSFQLSYGHGKYRTGNSWSSNNSLGIRANDRLSIDLSYNRSSVKLLNTQTLDIDHFKYEVLRSRWIYHHNRDLNLRLILQYSALDKRLDASFLLAYNFRPKSYLYLAYTDRFDEAPFIDGSGIERFPRFGSSNKLFQVKLSYLIAK